MNYNSLELHFTSRTRHVIDTLHKFLLKRVYHLQRGAANNSNNVYQRHSPDSLNTRIGEQRDLGQCNTILHIVVVSDATNLSRARWRRDSRG